MIKNYKLLKEVELKIEATRHLTPKEALKIMNDMYEFAMKFKQGEQLNKISAHAESLINLVTKFRLIAEHTP
jgi:hypothetical protein